MSWGVTIWQWLSEGWHGLIALIPAPILFKLYETHRNRIQVKVRNLGLAPLDTSCRGIAFEAENISSTLTSFEPTFQLTGYYEKQKQTYTFRFDPGSDRQLPPHVAKKFVAWHNNTENRIMLFLWFMTFELKLSRGHTVRVRALNTDGFQPLGFWRFHGLRLMFLLFGRLPY